ncbi:MAG TPA: glycosyltransferase family 1 protein [Terriglobales bacterium]|nr:glycosyltransferase family 1 protein [Terriglobales bacterium]
MKIAINASVLSGRITGVGVYVLQLLRALAELPASEGHEFVVLGVPEETSVPSAEHFEVVVERGLAGPRRVTWEQLELPRLCRSHNVDVLHCPDFARPVVSSVPVVNMIHDLSFYAAENFFPFSKRIYKRTLCRLAVAKSAGLIANSQFTKQEIVSRFGGQGRDVTVALLGGPTADGSQRRNPDVPFLLFIGTLEKRKNVAALVDAYQAVRKQRLPHRLVLVGDPGYGWEAIAEAISRNPFKSDIEVRGYVEPAELDALYRSAALFVFPSLHEGFGLPILEAMARGCPVLCSRSGAIPEVGGDAVEYSSIETPEALGANIARLLSSETRLSELAELGKKQLSKFSWRKCGELHLQAFQLAVGAQRIAVMRRESLPEQASLKQ